MNKETTDLSRRSFLTKGAAVAAGSAIIAIPALAANTKGAENAPAMMTNDPVYTESVQTLTYKTISAANNNLIIGTDALNIKEFSITGTDITNALNSAISALGSTGGQILIPRGVWTSNGGHTVTHAITIQGVGINSGVFAQGSVIKLNSGQSSYMFRLLAPTRNVGFKDFAIDLSNNINATGILQTDVNSTDKYIYSTVVENVGIYHGAYGIKIDSTSSSQFESNLNSFESVYFVGTKTGFYNNTINTGFTFRNCHFHIPTGPNNSGGTALDCLVVGNISLEHCVFAGSYERQSTFDSPNDGTTILKTGGMFNTINFYDCQDENVQYAYQNTSNAWIETSIVYRNCLIQSHFKFTGHGNVTLDSCRCTGTVYDSSIGIAKVFLKGVYNFFSYNTTTGAQITYRAPELHVSFVNSGSVILYENLEANAPVLKTAADIITPGGYYVANGTRGKVDVLSGQSYVQVYNTHVLPTSLVFLQLRSYDSGGARIREVDVQNGYFVIYLTQNAAANLSVQFLVEGAHL